MDSLTQIVLGAAVGEAVLGRKIGNRAVFLGAIAGTIPDLDVLITYFSDNPLTELKVHRAYSHSGFTHLLLAIPFAWLSQKLSRKKYQISFLTWYAFWFLGFFTHALLDCCTTYGTRLFLPFTDYQVAFNNIAVIDPLYTLPFLTCLLIMMFYSRNTKKRATWLKRALGISSIYLLLTFGLKFTVHQHFKATLDQAKIEYNELNTTPSILNAILWSGMAYNQDSIYLAEYSFLNRSIPVEWIGYPRNDQYFKEYESEALRTFKWFSDGNYCAIKENDSLHFFTTKFGRMRLDRTQPKEAFLFYSTFYKEGGKVRFSTKDPSDQRGNQFEMKQYFGMLMKRIGF